MIPLKWCYKCRQNLPLDLFAPSKRDKSGVMCRACQQAYSREHYQVNREKRMKQTGEYQRAHREQSRGYSRKAYAKNPEYYAEWQRQHPDQRAESSRKWRAAHPQKAQATRDAFYRRRPTYYAEHYQANKASYRANGAAYYAAHKEQKRSYGTRWRAANPAKARNLWMRRRARVRNATIHPVDLNAVLARDGWICHICGGFILRAELSFDHIIPLAKGGAHGEDNLSPAHLGCNKGKQARLDVPSVAPPRIHKK